MRRFQVSLTEDAARDLEEIFDYIAEHDDPAKANHVLDRIEEAVEPCHVSGAWLAPEGTSVAGHPRISPDLF